MKKILVLEGGFNEEHEISLNTSNEVQQSLERMKFKFEVLQVDPSSFSEKIKSYDDVLCFNALHGPFDEDGTIPNQFALHQNYPNPFNPSTQISFDVPQGSEHVMLNVYNILGQNVSTLVNGVMSPGRYTMEWNATDEIGNPVASGIYFYELRSPSFTARKKMLLIR